MTLTTAVQRIVSLVPSTTESVFGLAAGDRLVGCTRYCTEPPDDLVGVRRVGGTKNPDLEQIAALRPDLVLVNAEENRPEHLAWLRARFPVLEHTPRTVIEAADDLRELAERLDAIEEAQRFLLRIEAQLVAAEVAGMDRAPVRVFYAIWRKPWMSINRDTFIHDVLRVVGGANICADADVRYPEISPEQVRERDPAVVLLPSEPWEFDEAQRQDIEGRRLLGDAKAILCDGRDFCWHGVRMADGIGRAAELIGRVVRGSDRG